MRTQSDEGRLSLNSSDKLSDQVPLCFRVRIVFTLMLKELVNEKNPCYILFALVMKEVVKLCFT